MHLEGQRSRFWAEGPAKGQVGGEGIVETVETKEDDFKMRMVRAMTKRGGVRHDQDCAQIPRHF